MTDGFSSPEVQFSPEEILLKDQSWLAGIYERVQRELQVGCWGYHLLTGFCQYCSTEVPQHFFLARDKWLCQVKVRKEWGQPLWWQTVALLLLCWTRCFSASSPQHLSCAQHCPPWPVITCLSVWECFREEMGRGHFVLCMSAWQKQHVICLCLQDLYSIPTLHRGQVISSGSYGTKYQLRWERSISFCSRGEVFYLFQICGWWQEPVNTVVVVL